jgi:hypothetical protein
LLCVSDHANLRVVVRSARPAMYDDRGNLVRERLPGLAAEFTRGGCPEWAKQIAYETFEFRGLPDGVSRDYRLGVFDSFQAQQDNNWSDDDRQEVERKLVERAGASRDFIIVSKPKIPAPWSSYDELTVHGRRTAAHVAEKIVQIVRDTGVNPDSVLQYELENANRPEVVEAVRAFKVGSEQPEPEETVVAA